ncbi:MAG: rhamnogalacturonan acetylesterase [Chitinophagaceae bacterium]|nr:MAG: rhamnogalacturonan acetylesterase [Chitinophagaceae bacterium]
MKRLFPFLMLLAMMGFTIGENKKVTIWMIGDSTMSIKDPQAFPETGWGMPFAGFWNQTVEVENRAKNGRSTQSFLDEGLWVPVREHLKEGDYVLIQFGHNDEVPTKKTATSPEVFRANLERYISETKSKKAIPIVLSSVARRKFDSTGMPVDTHREYAAISKEVAEQSGVLFIDMNKESLALLQELGPEGSFFLFNHLAAGEHPNYPEGKKDDTHFNELGARRMAELVLVAIRKSDLALKDRILKPAIKN